MEQLVQKTLRRVFNDEQLVFDKSRFAGGLTNYNYLMNIKGTDYIIRQPGKMTELLVDRKIERINNSLASEMGINSDCIYFDETTGIKISVAIENSRNIAQVNPCAPRNLTAVSAILRNVHSFPKHFPNRFDWQTELASYERIIHRLKGGFFSDYSTLKAQLLAFVQQNTKTGSLVPCHNDTVPENFIVDSTGRTYLVDWEYSGMNDPCWDIAAYILESKLSEDAILYLIDQYFEHPLTSAEEVRIKSFILAQDLLWTVWALIRHYNGEDFLNYCCFRYDRFRRNIKLMISTPNCAISKMVTN